MINISDFLKKEISGQLQCRKSNYFARITRIDTSWPRNPYIYSGFVFDRKTGKTIRNICMWTNAGQYITDKESDFDIIGTIKEKQRITK
jgi:hypothetical protein